MKKLLIIASFFVLVASFHSCSDSTRDLPEILSRKKLCIVTDNSPLSYFSNRDTTYGFHYELAKNFADSLGVQLIIKTQSDLSKCVTGLQKGKYDIIARNIMITQQLKEEINFSKPILFNRQILVQRVDSALLIRNQLELAGKTLHVTKDSPYKLRIENLAQEIGDTIYIEELQDADSSLIFELVANGEIDYAVSDEHIALLYTKPNLDIQTAIGFTQMEAWGIRKTATELESALNDFLNSFMKTTTYKEIYEKYFGAPKNTSSPK